MFRQCFAQKFFRPEVNGVYVHRVGLVKTLDSLNAAAETGS